MDLTESETFLLIMALTDYQSMHAAAILRKQKDKAENNIDDEGTIDNLTRQMDEASAMQARLRANLNWDTATERTAS